MVSKMLGPHALSATALSRESGVAQATLSRWLLAAGSVPVMSDDRDPKSTRAWTVEEKLEVLVEASKLSEAELGEFLRRRGLHKAQLDEWRAGVAATLSQPGARKGTPE